MSYATLDDLIKRAGEDEILKIADRDRDGEADAEVVDGALGDAASIVDGYVKTRYDLPLLNTPDLVRTWTVSIARYTLHRNGAPEYVENDYKAAIRALQDLAKRLIDLPPDATGASAGTPSTGPLGASPAEVFSDENMRGWR